MTAVFLLAVFLAGLFILSFDSMKDIYEALILIVKKTADSFKGTDLTDRSELWERVRIVLGITLGMGKDRSVRAFFAISGIFSVTAMVLLAGRVALWLNALAAVTAAFLPYALLRIRITVRMSALFTHLTLNTGSS